ncbi:hypothetical protein PG994_015115 [Apiospora phragmitis]|uniref:Uncharacterized protein n=1 Tax=Apiospora phragmitis TaxID=2905665 RepID=A0ABR1SVL1_9PEZI
MSTFSRPLGNSTSSLRICPKPAKNWEQWSRAQEAGLGVGEGQQQVQTDKHRKRHAAAYMRIRVHELLDTVNAEYLDAKLRWVPAEFIEFSDGLKPNAATRA